MSENSDNREKASRRAAIIEQVLGSGPVAAVGAFIGWRYGLGGLDTIGGSFPTAKIVADALSNAGGQLGFGIVGGAVSHTLFRSFFVGFQSEGPKLVIGRPIYGGTREIWERIRVLKQSIGSKLEAYRHHHDPRINGAATVFLRPSVRFRQTIPRHPKRRDLEAQIRARQITHLPSEYLVRYFHDYEHGTLAVFKEQQQALIKRSLAVRNRKDGPEQLRLVDGKIQHTERIKRNAEFILNLVRPLPTVQPSKGALQETLAKETQQETKRRQWRLENLEKQLAALKEERRRMCLSIYGCEEVPEHPRKTIRLTILNAADELKRARSEGKRILAEWGKVLSHLRKVVKRAEIGGAIRRYERAVMRACELQINFSEVERRHVSLPQQTRNRSTGDGCFEKATRTVETLSVKLDRAIMQRAALRYELIQILRAESVPPDPVQVDTLLPLLNWDELSLLMNRCANGHAEETLETYFPGLEVSGKVSLKQVKALLDANSQGPAAHATIVPGGIAPGKQVPSKIRRSR